MGIESTGAANEAEGTAGLVRSASDFDAAVRQMLQAAAQGGVQRMWWVSPDFAGWPLNDEAVIDDLTRWARQAPGPLTWILQSDDLVRHQMPRLLAWRRTWSHKVECRQPVPQDNPSPELPTLLLTEPGPVLRLFDRRVVRGRVSANLDDRRVTKQQVDAILQQSAAAFPVTTLGL